MRVSSFSGHPWTNAWTNEPERRSDDRRLRAPERAIPGGAPDGGPWLYGREDVDTITATRMRLDGQREHAVLDEYGMPTEWRVAIQPEFK
jgi:hypothetical protein